MLQAIIKKGKVFCEEVPAPVVSEKHVLIKVVNSCISTGTEINTVSDSGKSLIQKAKEKPEKIFKVIDKLKSDGLSGAFKLVKNELNIGTPTGYSASGVIVAIGKGVHNYEIGDRIAAVSGAAHHAEYINVPVNLVCKIPEGVSFENSSSVALGAIAMQGVRRCDLRLGETCVVFGAGILGLLAIQMLRNAGIRVAAIDLNKERLDQAKLLGAEIIFDGRGDVVKSVNQWSGGFGADAVLFTAATRDSIALSNSFQMCRKRGKVILVGVSGMEINRADMYQKELDFLISTSYGPGRYDANYEEKGIDYPFGYVRWTENRNMQEYLRLLSTEQIKLDQIITNRFDINNISEAYKYIRESDKKPLMVVVEYGKELEKDIDRKIVISPGSINKDKINIALIGAGSFAKSVHLPNIQKLNNKFNLYAVMNRDGYKGKAIAENFGAQYTTTDYNEILNDPSVDLVFICTRHDSHAGLVLKALEKNKNVFVEKPLATNSNELQPIKEFFNSSASDKPSLMVGFNRRFSKYLIEIRKHTSKRINPMIINYRMNAGFVTLDHWIHESGGRIVGEGCHIIDLVTSLTNSKIKSISHEILTPSNGKYSSNDNKTILLKYEDGSVAAISYFAVGSKELEKEYMEIHFDEKSIILDDYKLLKGYGLDIKEMKSDKSDKGHLEELEEVYTFLTKENSKWPIPLWDLIQTTEAAFTIG